jgi:putative protein-disulfide isomerase
MSHKLIYAFDPLCGWCYGFIPAMRALIAAHPDLTVDLRMGGLITGERIRHYADMAGYIRGAHQQMTSVTGMALGEPFFDRILASPTIIASSLVPCAALLQVRTARPDKTLDFAHALQIAHFQEGEDLNDPLVYARIAAETGLDLAFDLPGPRDLTAALAAEFTATRRLGVRAYPTLLAQDSDGSVAELARDYDPTRFVAIISDWRANPA